MKATSVTVSPRIFRANPWVRLVRPMQWPKNGVVLAALVFGRVYGDPANVAAAIGAVVVFCLVSSAGYIFNDWVDIEGDRHHPLKRARPLASGVIAPGPALQVAGVLVVTSFALALAISPWLLLVVAAYAALMTAYSLRLKRVVIIDVFIIGAGFLLRAIAGGAAVQVSISAWLMLCTVLLALFLGFCKRRNEMMTLEHRAELHRSSLRGYTPQILDHFILLTASSTIMAYSMYSFTAESVPTNHAMMITIPIVAFALFRYLYLVYGRSLGGAPEILLFRDLPLAGAILLWGCTVLLVFWIG
jgi:4-hydroxybenzoate polyprenyltransferase